MTRFPFVDMLSIVPNYTGPGATQYCRVLNFHRFQLHNKEFVCFLKFHSPPLSSTSPTPPRARILVQNWSSGGQKLDLTLVIGLNWGKYLCPIHGRTKAPDGTGGQSREKRVRNWEGENKPGSILLIWGFLVFQWTFQFTHPSLKNEEENWSLDACIQILMLFLLSSSLAVCCTMPAA